MRKWWHSGYFSCILVVFLVTSGEMVLFLYCFFGDCGEVSVFMQKLSTIHF